MLSLFMGPSVAKWLILQSVSSCSKWSRGWRSVCARITTPSHKMNTRTPTPTHSGGFPSVSTAIILVFQVGKINHRGHGYRFLYSPRPVRTCQEGRFALERFALASFAAYWRTLDDVSDDEVIRRLHAEAELLMPLDDFMRRLNSDEIKTRLRANTEASCSPHVTSQV